MMISSMVDILAILNFSDTLRVMSKIVRKVKQGKATPVLAHRDSDGLTYRNVAVPQIVPLYANFDQGRPVGRVHLMPKFPGLIYAIIDLDLPADYGDYPSVILALTDSTRIREDEITYAEGGQVTAASIVHADAWKSIYGEEAA